MRMTRLLAACCRMEQGGEPEALLERNLRVMLDCLKRAKVFQPDFVVFPETCLHQGFTSWPDRCRHAQPVPGPVCEAVGEKARELNSHVWLLMVTRVGQDFHNLDFNSKKLPDIRAKCGKGVDVRVCRPEAFFTLASAMPDKSVEDIEAEFELEDLRDYFERSGRIQAEAR